MNKVYLLIVTLIFFSCNKEVKDNEISKNNEIKKSKIITEQKSPEDFDSFFKSFSSDKKFRMAHIKFPLEGFNSDENEFNSKNKPYLWDKESWLFYSEEDFINDKTEDEIKTNKIEKDSSVIYRIYKENSGYDIQYTFKKTGNKWSLIYYSYKIF